MRKKGGHGLKARIKINDIPQGDIDILNRSTYTVEIKDTATGKVESRITRPMRSFTANFLRLLWGRMTGTACTGGLDINDTAIDESSGKATNLKCVGATTGLKKFGICIGTGTGAVAQTDNKLTWDTGFTTYGATTLKTATTISGSDIYFEIQKAFVNSTGSTRTIEEIGICTTGEGTEADNNTNVLIARELTGGDAVLNGQTATVEFRISSTFTTDGTINKNFMDALYYSMVSPAVTSWRQNNSDIGIRAQAMLSFGGALYVFGSVGGDSNLVKKSLDGGVTWATVRSNGDANGYPASGNNGVVVHDGKMFIMGGYGSGAGQNFVYYSTDGQTWTKTRDTGDASGYDIRWNFAVYSYDGKLWVAGGYNGSVLGAVYNSTNNGATWTLVKATPSWTSRYSMAFCVHGGKMWIAGGTNGSFAHVSSVYYSTNGDTWTQSTAAAGWTASQGGALVSYNGKMYYMGGTNWTTYYNFIYSSTDGATWTSEGNASWAGRAYHTYSTVIWQQQIILHGGSTGSDKKDVHAWAVGAFYNTTGASIPADGRIDAASGSVYGITAGTGTTNFTGADTTLVTPVADGSTSGKLVYGNMQDAGRMSEPTVSGSDNIMRLERDFTNSSGGSITIKEVGLSAKGLDALGLLLMRGKVDKAVADGASVRVAIELETTV